VAISPPVDGQLFAFGDTVPYKVTVTDPEDGAIDCGRVRMTYILGHDSHGHPITSKAGCSGTLTIPPDGEHDEAANIFGVFDAEYTDNGGLTVHTQHRLQPRHRQAEHFTTSAGVQLIDKPPAEGGRTVGDIHNGDWIAFNPYALTGATSFTARVSSAGAGGTLSLRAGSPTGAVLGSATVPVTGGWEVFTTVSGPLSGAPAGTTSLYLVFTGSGGGALYDVDSFTLNAGAQAPYDVLVFSKTAGFRHDSIPAGIQAIRDLGAANGFTVTATENAAAFTPANLAPYEAVVFLNTTGDVLNDSQQAAFESYIRSGGGFAGVHAAADTEYDWPFYGDLVGAYFASHPAIQPATIRVEDRTHPATSHLGATWNRTDEWYNYRSNVRSTARVLATLDESTYTGGTMGTDHPHAWCKAVGGGRSFYTGGGHTQASYADAAFRAHLLGGIRYASGAVPADCSPNSPGGRVEAESFSSQSGTQTVDDPGAHGGIRVGYIDDGDWLGFAAVSVNGRTGFAARVASGGPGGTIEIRSGSPGGPLLGTVGVPNTGGYDAFVDVSTPLTAGTGTLVLRFTGTGGGLFDIDDFALTSDSATNLALHRLATADSSCAPGEGADKAVNGSVTGGNADKWCSLGTAKWWRVDLQASVPVGRIVIRHAAAGGENPAWNTRDFDLQTSTDGTTWTTVAQARGNTTAVTNHTFPAATARHVRLLVLTPTSTTNTAARVYEVEVYAT
ncbi:MAG TPA: ThuA domain-containing protein, partial [Pilimelia sp.]|nr:ThuA domain-containing protein [Pilimelia sp.]